MTLGGAVVGAMALAVLVSSTAWGQEPLGQPATNGSPERASVPEQDTPGFFDKAKRWAERTRIVERLNGDIDGWYPRLGGMTRGSGFGIGPGYRFHVDNVLVDLSAGYSLKAYKAVDAKVRWLQLRGEMFELWTNYRFEDFPQEDFFGMGLDSLRATRTSYDFDSSEVSVYGLVRATPWLRLGATVGYLSPEVGPGTDDRYPSIEAVFTDAAAPGLAAQPDFLRATLSADVDYRDERGLPSSGGLYRASFGIWDDRTLQRYDFRRFDVDLLQYVPLVSDKTHVITGHLGASFVNNDAGHRVPFYFLPYVGGVDTIRSFHEFRFKDENALWMSGEYRWQPLEYASIAAFIDAGKVSTHYQGLNGSGLKKAYGLGLRVHLRRQTVARIDVGTGGGEGWKVFLKLGPRS